MPRSVAHPPDDPRLWRRLVARAHPDTGGDHDLFLFAQAVREVVCGGEPDPRAYKRPRPNTSPADAAERVPFSPFEDFDALSEKVLEVAEDVPEVYAYLLRLVEDCHAVEDGPLYHQQNRGATYKQLAAIAYRAGMSKAERVQWYRLAESLPLAQRHAGHLLDLLHRRQGAA